MKFINTQKEIFLGTRYFKDRVVPVGYRLGDERKVASPYFASKKFFVPMSYNAYFSKLNGYESDRYISMDLYYFYIFPCLDRREFARVYADKNNYSLFFAGANQPETVIKNRNGIFFDSEEQPISVNAAVDLCFGVEDALIIKPTIETGEGRGVELLDHSTKDAVRGAFQKHQLDFIVQKKVVQHEQMAQLNPTSLNTMRIMTYRGLDGKVRHLKDKTFFRVGLKGAVRDNIGSGGGMCQVFDDGRVNDSVVRYNSMVVGSFKELHGVSDFRIPHYQDALAYAEKLHERMPYFDFIGWDIAIDANGRPLFLEFNLPCEVGSVQQGCGPVFDDATLDEIMGRIANVRSMTVTNRVNVFRPGFDHLLQMAGEKYDVR